MNINIASLKSNFISCLMPAIMLLPFTASAQLSVTTNKTATQLAASIAGPGVTVTNASLTCPNNASGTFSGGAATANLDIANGIILTTGSASVVSQPDDQYEGKNNNAAGDAQIGALVNASSTHDACVLAFDFVPNCNTINLQYQFASEEYPYFNCTQYNDVFGAFISGGAYGTTGTNIAVVPGTTIPVSINTINDGTNQGGNTTECFPGTYSQYYVDNQGAGAPIYDGMTTLLTAHANVVPGTTYHLKLGVVDVSGSNGAGPSSGVFLKEGSLTTSMAPAISGCPTDKVVNNASCGAYVTYTIPTATSTCGTITTTSNHNSGDWFPLGTTPVTYTFTSAGGTSTCSFNVTVNGTGTTTPTITVTPANSTYTGGVPTNIYLGYGPQSATIHVACASGSTISWSGPTSRLSSCNYSSCATRTFTPTAAGTYTYTITVTKNGCSSSKQITFCVKDIRVSGKDHDYDNDDDDNDNHGNNHGCGWHRNSYGCHDYNDCYDNDGNKKVYICHVPPGNPGNAQTLSIGVSAVAAHLSNHSGDRLGKCGQSCPANALTKRANTEGEVIVTEEALSVKAYPNPFSDGLHVSLMSNLFEQADITVTDITGRQLETVKAQPIGNEVVVGRNLAPGIYIVEVRNGETVKQVKVVKGQ